MIQRPQEKGKVGKKRRRRRRGKINIKTKKRD
jgi:hypothetical protein